MAENREILFRGHLLSKSEGEAFLSFAEGVNRRPSLEPEGSEGQARGLRSMLDENLALSDTAWFESRSRTHLGGMRTFTREGDAFMDRKFIGWKFLWRFRLPELVKMMQEGLPRSEVLVLLRRVSHFAKSHLGQVDVDTLYERIPGSNRMRNKLVIQMRTVIPGPAGASIELFNDLQSNELEEAVRNLHLFGALLMDDLRLTHDPSLLDAAFYLLNSTLEMAAAVPSTDDMEARLRLLDSFKAEVTTLMRSLRRLSYANAFDLFSEVSFRLPIDARARIAGALLNLHTLPMAIGGQSAMDEFFKYYKDLLTNAFLSRPLYAAPPLMAQALRFFASEDPNRYLPHLTPEFVHMSLSVAQGHAGGMQVFTPEFDALPFTVEIPLVLTRQGLFSVFDRGFESLRGPSNVKQHARELALKLPVSADMLAAWEACVCFLRSPNGMQCPNDQMEMIMENMLVLQCAVPVPLSSEPVTSALRTVATAPRFYPRPPRQIAISGFASMLANVIGALVEEEFRVPGSPSKSRGRFMFPGAPPGLPPGTKVVHTQIKGATSFRDTLAIFSLPLQDPVFRRAFREPMDAVFKALYSTHQTQSTRATTVGYFAGMDGQFIFFHPPWELWKVGYETVFNPPGRGQPAKYSLIYCLKDPEGRMFNLKDTADLDMAVRAAAVALAADGARLVFSDAGPMRLMSEKEAPNVSAADLKACMYHFSNPVVQLVTYGLGDFFSHTFEFIEKHGRHASLFPHGVPVGTGIVRSLMQLILDLHHLACTVTRRLIKMMTLTRKAVEEDRDPGGIRAGFLQEMEDQQVLERAREKVLEVLRDAMRRLKAYVRAHKTSYGDLLY